MLSHIRDNNDKINFYFFDNLPYFSRLTATFILYAAGFLIQYYSGWNMFLFIIGTIVIFLGVLLNTVRGFHSKVKKIKKKEWKEVTIEEFKRIKELQKKNLSWDADFVDISCPRGFASLIAIVILFVVLKFFIFSYFGPLTDRICTVDYFVLLLPFWITGMRTIYQNRELIIKVDMMLYVYEQFKKRTEIVIEPYLFIGKSGDKDVPDDCRMMFKLKDQPDDFMGIQVQSTINWVQSNAYPYVYCVILAKKGFNLQEKLQNLQKSKKIVTKFPKNDEVEVFVVRQKTTKTSGYFTNKKAVLKIINFCLDTSIKLINSIK